VDKPQPQRPLRVFLCHSSGDKQAVRDLYKQLEADGFDPWLDEEDLIPGEEWQKEIPRAVRRSDVVLVCLSVRSIMKSGYVQKEISYALDVAEEQPEGTIFIIPLRLEPCEVPERLSRWHWVDLYSENGYDKLKRALRRRRETMTEDSDPPPEEQLRTRMIPQSARPYNESHTTTESEPVDSLSEEQPPGKVILHSPRLRNESPVTQDHAIADFSAVETATQTTGVEKHGAHRIPRKVWAIIIIAVGVANVVAFTILLAARSQFFNKPVSQLGELQYKGRVVNAVTDEPVEGAKVTIEEAGGITQTQYTDADGTFRLMIRHLMKSGRIKVEADHYHVYDTNIAFPISEIEQVRLVPVNRETGQ
jgi:hypothetical protein